MALHGKNGIKNDKFNIRTPQSFSEIDTAEFQSPEYTSTPQPWTLIIRTISCYTCKYKALISRLLILLNFTSLSEPEPPRFRRLRLRLWLRAKCSSGSGSGFGSGSGSGSTSLFASLIILVCLVTWPRHRLFISMWPILISYLKHTYENTAWIWVMIISQPCCQGPGPKTSKHLILTLDLTLISYVTSISSSFTCFRCALWRSFEFRLARLSAAIGSRDSTGFGAW